MLAALILIGVGILLHGSNMLFEMNPLTVFATGLAGATLPPKQPNNIHKRLDKAFKWAIQFHFCNGWFRFFGGEVKLTSKGGFW